LQNNYQASATSKTYLNGFGKLILFLPLFNLIVDLLPYAPSYEDVSNISNYRNYIILGRYIINAIPILYFIYKGAFHNNPLKKPLLLFIFYLVVLIPFSSDLFITVNYFIKVCISMLMLPLGYFIVSSLDDLKKLNRYIIILMPILLLYIAASNIYRFGETMYKVEDTFLMGFIGYYGLYVLSIIIILLPILLLSYNNKISKLTILVLSILSILLLMLSMRRTTVIIIIASYLTYFFFKKKITKELIISVVVVLVLFLTYGLYKESFLKRFEKRQDRFQIENLTKEGRYVETELLIEDFKEKPEYWFFGKGNLFNSANDYGSDYYPDRQLHVDYNVLLHGSGLLGLILYLNIFYRLINKAKSLNRFVPNDEHSLRFKSIFYGLIIASLALSFSAGLYAISFRLINFLYLGAILKIFMITASNYKNNLITKKQI